MEYYLAEITTQQYDVEPIIVHRNRLILAKSLEEAEYLLKKEYNYEEEKLIVFDSHDVRLIDWNISIAITKDKNN